MKNKKKIKDLVVAEVDDGDILNIDQKSNINKSKQDLKCFDTANLAITSKVKQKKVRTQQPIIKVGKKVCLGLALGGGGGLGVAHIGVLKAFEELGIDFKVVAGTSAGSIIGALYAKGFTSDKILSIAKELRVKDIRNSKFILKPSAAQNIEKIMINVLGKDLVFSELNKPFCAVCTDMKSGREIHLSSGSVAKAVSASCAVPGVFKPVQYNDMHLVDGGLKNNLPTDVVRKLGANIVVAVELNYSRGFGTQSLGLFSVLSSTLGIMMASSVAPKLSYADIVLQPDLKNFSKMNLDDLDERVNAGYNCVMASKAEIIKVLRSKPKKSKLQNAKNKNK